MRVSVTVVQCSKRRIASVISATRDKGGMSGLNLSKGVEVENQRLVS
jgi:hypothetical protein